MRSNIGRNILNVLGYLAAFLIIQYVMMLVVGTIWLVVKGTTLSAAINQVATGMLANDGMALAIITAASSVVTILVFMLLRWSPFSRTYLRSRPWGVLFWVFVLTFGTVIPSEWLLEQLDVEMSESMQHVFEQIMSTPAGYVAIGLLAPLAEEMVFRGAILRVLLKVFDRRWHWLPIVISAVLFGAVHGNMAQFLHATLLGLLLGWMYYRTDSIVPGVVLHWVNNSIAYVIFNLLPQATEGKLIDLFDGNQRAVWMALGFSLCILLPSLFQLNERMKRQH
ncbi:MAG: CPBP family intramembrane metalloprotease [Prevotella sp.]|nr:CPBP family intramembrane metalloprotease [Prevotella sp.]MBR5697969.1 CPBP family intramembrane metalloprotease [Prevotella sp.]